MMTAYFGCASERRNTDFPAMTHTETQALGALGERIAARWLARDGWQVVDRRWRSGRRDLDLLAIRENVVAFVGIRNSIGMRGV